MRFRVADYLPLRALDDAVYATGAADISPPCAAMSPRRAISPPPERQDCCVFFRCRHAA